MFIEVCKYKWQVVCVLLSVVLLSLVGYIFSMQKSYDRFDYPVRPAVEEPKFSVLLSTSKGAKYLSRAIASVLGQTFEDFELIIINDGNDRKADEEILNFMKKDKRIVYLKNEGVKGRGYSRNRALDLAKGKYITNVDDDDVLFFSLLANMYKFLEENPTVVVSWAPSFQLYDDGTTGRREYKSTNPVEMIRENIVVNSGATFHKDFLLQHNIRYDESIQAEDDYDLWAKILMNGGKIAALDDVLGVGFRRHYERKYYSNLDFERDAVKEKLKNYFAPEEEVNCGIWNKLLEHPVSVFEESDVRSIYNTNCMFNWQNSLWCEHTYWKDYLVPRGENRYCRHSNHDCGMIINKGDNFFTIKWDRWGEETFFRNQDKQNIYYFDVWK